MAQGELSFFEFDEPDRRFSRQADFFQGKRPKRSPTQAPATENKAKSARKRVLTVSQLTRLIKLALSEHLDRYRERCHTVAH